MNLSSGLNKNINTFRHSTERALLLDRNRENKNEYYGRESTNEGQISRDLISPDAIKPPSADTGSFCYHIIYLLQI